jgi:hypothetical protein
VATVSLGTNMVREAVGIERVIRGQSASGVNKRHVQGSGHVCIKTLQQRRADLCTVAHPLSYVVGSLSRELTSALDMRSASGSHAVDLGLYAVWS